MPFIDVDDILTDPDIAGDSFVVVRRKETVNDFGESTVLEERQEAIGCVLPGPTPLQREEGGYQVQPDQIKVVTSFRLRGAQQSAGKNYQPDLIYYGGNYFIVTNLTDYSAFGAGFIEADCDAIAYVDEAARTPLQDVGRLDFSESANAGLGDGNDQ